MSRARGCRALVALLILCVSLTLGASPAAAHTDFESSTPAANAVVAEPVSVVTLVFTAEATPAGDQFVAFTAAGELQEPFEIRTSDDKVFELDFDPPLAGGQIGIRWSVQAGDAHPVEGAFTFTVDAPAVVAATVPPTTLATTPPTILATAPPTTLPTTDVDAAVPATDATPDTVVDGQADAETAETEAETETETEAAEAAIEQTDASGVAPAADDIGPQQSLDEFLLVDNSQPGEGTATTGRVIGFVGATLGLGGLAFVGSVLRGRRSEMNRALGAVRLLGGVIAVGAAIEYVGVSRISADSMLGSLSSSAGAATVLRMLGGVGLLFGLRAAMSPVTQASARSLSAAVIEDCGGGVEANRSVDSQWRWLPTSASWPALCGAGMIVVSFWFDGHTVSKGVRPLHALVNSVHVVAGAVWVGGVVAMAAVAWSRSRAGRPMRAAEMVVRFSKIATIALASVIVVGLVMAVLVLDSFGEITGTPWGKILLLKTGAVGLAAVGGAYNHFRLVPALDADPDSPELQAELRSTVTAEAIMLVFVVIVTAWLVAAAS